MVHMVGPYGELEGVLFAVSHMIVTYIVDIAHNISAVYCMS